MKTLKKNLKRYYGFWGDVVKSSFSNVRAIVGSLGILLALAGFFISPTWNASLTTFLKISGGALLIWNLFLYGPYKQWSEERKKNEDAEEKGFLLHVARFVYDYENEQLYAALKFSSSGNTRRVVFSVSFTIKEPGDKEGRRLLRDARDYVLDDWLYVDPNLDQMKEYAIKAPREQIMKPGCSVGLLIEISSTDGGRRFCIIDLMHVFEDLRRETWVAQSYVLDAAKPYELPPSRLVQS